jgi:hypothetical protein
MSSAQFTKETFWSLLSKEQGIAVPIIQRAYAQGGRGNDATVEEKGHAFLKYIVDTLCSSTNKIELDFIYGTVEDGKIMPLDGQQRLTTLFLLHWYIAQKENHLTDDVKDILKRFTYETRSSARYFCRNLCDFKASMESTSSLLRDVIENERWFVLSWKNDPTVLSMLGMLDKIHKKLREHEELLWDKLVSAKDIAPIIFFYTPLEAFNLTDELYIKMNARGKELTAFEKFKASIEKKIDAENWDDGKQLDKTFGNQMDNNWTDLFWQYRSPVKNNTNQITAYQIDKSLLRFFAAVLVNHYAGIDEEKTMKLFNNAETIVPADFDKESYSYLYETTNLFYNAWGNLKDVLPINNAVFWWGDTPIKMNCFDDFFKLFIAFNNDRAMTWQQRVLFYGFTLYLKNNTSLDTVKLSDWLCFVRNIITNGIIDAYTPFVSAKKRLDEFAQSSGNIYLHLISATTASGFASEQIREEIRKARIYQSSPGTQAIIQEMENCNFCRGRVSFVFECLDVKDSVSNTNHLKRMKDVLFEHLNQDDISDDFRRAMFVCNENYYYYWGVSSYLDEEKYCLIDGRNDLVSTYAYSNDSHTKCLKKLLLLLCQSDLETIIKSYKPAADTPNWKKRLITEPELLKRCRKHFITIPWGDKSDHCHLLHGQRPSESYYNGPSYEEIR